MHKFLLSLMLFVFTLMALLFTLSVQAAEITWALTTPAGTVDFASPELDVIAAGETLKHYERFIAWACAAYALTDDAGTPEDPTDDFPVGCGTAGKQAAHFRAWAKGQWRGTRSNVLRWEEDQRRVIADAAGADIPEE